MSIIVTNAIAGSDRVSEYYAQHTRCRIGDDYIGWPLRRGVTRLSHSASA
jgi:hypothetical protein